MYQGTSEYKYGAAVANQLRYMSHFFRGITTADQGPGGSVLSRYVGGDDHLMRMEAKRLMRLSIEYKARLARIQGSF